MLGPGHTTHSKIDIFLFSLLFSLPLFSSLGYSEVFLEYFMADGFRLHCSLISHFHCPLFLLPILILWFFFL